ncbi:serine proteinase stubble-like [Ornithodoros turicata]|uniref:serine proteinase stubble-like n=1 Tax=Ornithodoros turicata TaxID=34597 RepID=UPI003138B8A8
MWDGRRFGYTSGDRTAVEKRHRQRRRPMARVPSTLIALVFALPVISIAKGLKINPTSCENAMNEKGTCMFVWECIKLEGQHLGTCRDGFLYGSCCRYDDSINSVVDAPHVTDSSSTASPASYHKPHKPPHPLTKPPTTGFNSATSNSNTYPPRNFTLIYLTPTSSQTVSRPTSIVGVRPTTQVMSTSIQTTKATTTTKKPSSVASSQTTTSNTRWPPTLRPPGITSFWSLFRPRPTLMPLITFLPTRKPTVTSTVKPALQSTSQLTAQTVQYKPSTSVATSATPVATTVKPPPPPLQAESSQAVKNPKADCGMPTLLPQTKVVGGKSAAFGAWPWQVSVRRTSFFGLSSTHRCGGAILNRYWIATAGHCVDDLLLSQIRIRVGEYDFSSELEPLPFVERGAKKKLVHPKYNFFTYENDLALVKMSEPLEFKPHIAPICLPPDNETDDLIGQNATVTGWGRLSEGGVLPSVLQQVKVPIVSNEKCKNMFLAAGRHEYIPNIFMCAGFEEGGRDSCQGDSGGPLQLQGKDGRWFLAGIISWGIGCAEPNLPGVCTRISRFKEWIIKSTT